MFWISIFLHSDDRLIEDDGRPEMAQGIESALIVIAFIREIVIRLAYGIYLDLLVFVPSRPPIVLGFIVDNTN